MRTFTLQFETPQALFSGKENIVINLAQEKISFTESDKKITAPVLATFSDECAAKLEADEQFRTAKAYRTAARTFIRFVGNKNVLLSDINAPLMRRYEEHLKSQVKSLNTVSFLLRNLRVLFNRAIDEKRMSRPQENPFLKLCTGIYPTKKRALDKAEIGRLARLDIANSKKMKKRKGILTSRQTDALKYFLFCFHARGMSFVDLAFLKKSDIRNGEIFYKRRKTGRSLLLKINAPMKEIILYFAERTKNSPYVFPIINPDKGNEYKQYCSALTLQNKTLKSIGKKAESKKPLTTHVARHTWATLAKRERIPHAVISEALGHRDERTTAIYLDSFEPSVLFKASERVSRVVLGTT